MKKSIKIGLGIAGVFIVFRACVGIQSSKMPQQESPPIKETCEQVSALFGASSSLTDIQKPEVWAKQFYYRKFEWDLVVQDVLEDGNNFTVVAKCKNSTALIADVYIHVSWIAKKYVASIRKGEIRHFSGGLKGYNVLGLQAVSFENE